MSPEKQTESLKEDNSQNKRAKVLVDAVSGKVRTVKLRPQRSLVSPQKTEHSDEDPLIGKEIDGYRLIERIAEGGMGFIYKACSTDDPDVLRAMKILRPELSQHSFLVHRFKREARVLQRLSHPRIVALESSGYIEGIGHYMCQEWLSGYSLKQLYRQHRQLFPQKQIYRWVEQIGHALHFAHSKNVIHRDVKPDNIFLLTDEDDTINPTKGIQKSLRLIDFGIAVMLDESPLPEEIAGTPRYMAPEQILGEKIGPQTDFYAFGNLLFEMLTRRPVFPYRNSDQLKHAHLHELPPSLSDVRPDLLFPPELEAIIRRLLEKNPENRPSSFPDFFQELGAVLLKKEITKRTGKMSISIGNAPKTDWDDTPTPPPTPATPQPQHTSQSQPTSPPPTQQAEDSDPFLDAFLDDPSSPSHEPLPPSHDADTHTPPPEEEWESPESPPPTSPILLATLLILAFLMLTGLAWAFFTFFLSPS